VVGRPESKADDATRGYLGVLRAGGVPFFMIVLVGAGVSFLIQHIDSFAATDLLSNAATVGAKAQSLGTLHLTAAVWVGAVAWTLDRSERYKTLSPRERVGFLGVNLLVVLLTLGGGSLTSATGAVPVVVAVLVGCGHALLNTLPQVVKWAVLDTAGRADKGTASAVLGYAKRVPNLILSLAILSRTGGRPSDEVMYGLLVIVTAVSLLALLAYSFTIRRHRLVILLAPEHLDAVRTAIGRAVYLERNLTVRFSPPGAPQGQTDAALVRLRVRLYTSGDKRAFVRGLTNTIRGMPGTDSVAPE
jgi:hypothetical protein